METSDTVDIVSYEKGVAASFGVHTTPTALLNESFMVLLVGSKQLSNFRLFFATSTAMESLPTTDDSDLAGVWELIEGRWIAGAEDER